MKKAPSILITSLLVAATIAARVVIVQLGGELSQTFMFSLYCAIVIGCAVVVLYQVYVLLRWPPPPDSDPNRRAGIWLGILGLVFLGSLASLAPVTGMMTKDDGGLLFSPLVAVTVTIRIRDIVARENGRRHRAASDPADQLTQPDEPQV